MKINRKILLAIAILTPLLVLTGCVPKDANGNPTGIIWQYLGSPMSSLITYFAENQALGYGLGLIVVTIIARLIILPLGLYQSYKATYQTEKRNYISHILDPINQKLKIAREKRDQAGMMAAQQELMAAQKANGISTFGGIGCLPLLIQLPFFAAIYSAVQYNEGVTSATFMGIDLGSSNILLTIFVGLFYLLQTWMMTLTMDKTLREQQPKGLLYITPIMMVFMSLSLPASVQIYWVVGGLVVILQQLIVMFLIRPHLRKKVLEEFEKNPPKTVPTQSPTSRRDVTPDNSNPFVIPKKTNRNAGKQQKRK